MPLRTIRPSSAGIVATAEPVFAGVIAYLAFGDRLQPLQLVGAAVIIAGIITVQTAAPAGAGQGWTVVTDLQLEGRGRRGRPWIAPDGTALLFSTILQPPVDVLALLPLLAALSVAGGIEVATGVVPELKWPNDILFKGHKLAGILLEHPGGAAVVLGVGVNVNQVA